MPEDTTVVLRHPHTGTPGLFEVDVAAVCGIIGLAVVWASVDPVFVEDPESETGWREVLGKEATFARDLKMVREADLVLTFVDEESAVDTRVGTTSLALKAAEEETPVYQFAYRHLGDDRWELVLVGSDDPSDKYLRYVPT